MTTDGSSQQLPAPSRDLLPAFKLEELSWIETWNRLFTWVKESSPQQRLKTIQLLAAGQEPTTGHSLADERGRATIKALTTAFLKYDRMDERVLEELLQYPNMAHLILSESGEQFSDQVLEKSMEWLEREPNHPHPHLEPDPEDAEERIRQLGEPFLIWRERNPHAPVPDTYKTILQKWITQDYPNWEGREKANFTAREWRGYRAWCDILADAPNLSDEFLLTMHQLLLERDSSMHTELARHPAGRPELWTQMLEDIDSAKQRAFFIDTGVRDERFRVDPDLQAWTLADGSTDSQFSILPNLRDPEKFRQHFRRLAGQDPEAATVYITRVDPLKATRALEAGDLQPLLASPRGEHRQAAFQILRQMERKSSGPEQEASTQGRTRS